MITSLRLLIFTGFCLSGQTIVCGAVVFSSFGAVGYGYADDDEISLLPGGMAARSFSITSSACKLDKIVLPLIWENGSAPVILSIQEDAGGIPSGIPLESFTMERPTSVGALFLMTATSVIKPLLDSGTYYIVLSFPNTETGIIGWSLTSSGIPGPLLLNSGNGSGWTSRAGEDIAMAVYGNPVPEPAASIVLLGSFLLIASRRTRSGGSSGGNR